ncbi:erythromycin esterase family protein [Nocardia cyriacigeorgica]|uniref:Erythromycin esterase n=1 Tax=Nocardia cyriacigeorgica TaxID=135487 RepID=A0A4U8VW86_9NOCA|nr:erythromycin esterase family protein [Nocardia cyriacigeorgica]MBF6317315.1 erythromycin esterase family protein [Nocardia cyriacigeorgica]MBF6514294.1 erythromycin esterase family protein [Nocardia cyriacigeorgica]MBF6532133.1 erythromycin esterase family protein [Nocardia cyriacigeorgica]VFA97940.1 Erythromycin esterase [Nocardia cyriacigeorgica]
MSTAISLRAIGRECDDSANLGRAVDELLAARSEPTALLGLGEPTHGIAAFPVLRNELLAQLVDRGFRSIVLEIDMFGADLVNDYVTGARGEIDTVLATGFSHRFGGVPGNRELVEWLRAYNAGRPPQDRVRFYGFDFPGDQVDIASPRPALRAVVEYLPEPLRPGSARELEALLGDDADWTNQAALYDPAAAIGNCERARALRILADDLAGALRRAAPTLRPADPDRYDRAVAYARTAVGQLRFHAAMAESGAERLAHMLAVRAEIMADNLLDILAREQHRGPALVFAHNVHLQYARPTMAVGENEVRWGNAGALIALALGERYAFIAADANPHSEPGTLQGVLAAATTGRALFPAGQLRDALPADIRADEPMMPGHLPLTPADLDGADAVIWIADTDGQRHQYW